MATKKAQLNKLRDPRLTGLRTLFREVLQQIPPEAAEKLRREYLEGRDVVFVIRQSSHGPDGKCAFTCGAGYNVEIKPQSSGLGDTN